MTLSHYRTWYMHPRQKNMQLSIYQRIRIVSLRLTLELSKNVYYQYTVQCQHVGAAKNYILKRSGTCDYRKKSHRLLFNKLIRVVVMHRCKRNFRRCILSPTSNSPMRVLMQVITSTLTQNLDLSSICPHMHHYHRIRPVHKDQYHIYNGWRRHRNQYPV